MATVLPGYVWQATLGPFYCYQTLLSQSWSARTSAQLLGSRRMKQMARFTGRVGFRIPCSLSDAASNLPAAPKGASTTNGIFNDRVISS